VLTDRCLADLHVRDVPLLLLSHYHVDHVGGIAGVFHGRHVGRVVTGPLAEPASGVEIVRDVLDDHGLTVESAPVGSALDVGRVHLDVLAPAVAMRGTRSDPNNSSLIVRATVDGVRILLPGDAEVEEQQSVLAAGVDLSADVLKVPHHGSAYFDDAFLRAVHAKVAVISVGLHNDYGHPSPLLLAELGRIGLPTRRTDHDGDVAVVADDHHELGAVVRGTRASTVGLGVEPAGVAGSEPVAAVLPGSPSDRHATMTAWLPARSTTSTSAAPFRRACWWSATTSSSPPVPSSRSPPRPETSTRTSRSTRAPVPRSPTAS
jgi:competence protein ComEC